jgi:hypothetical protein
MSTHAAISQINGLQEEKSILKHEKERAFDELGELEKKRRLSVTVAQQQIAGIRAENEQLKQTIRSLQVEINGFRKEEEISKENSRDMMFLNTTTPLVESDEGSDIATGFVSSVLSAFGVGDDSFEEEKSIQDQDNSQIEHQPDEEMPSKNRSIRINEENENANHESSRGMEIDENVLGEMKEKLNLLETEKGELILKIRELEDECISKGQQLQSAQYEYHEVTNRLQFSEEERKNLQMKLNNQFNVEQDLRKTIADSEEIFISTRSEVENLKHENESQITQVKKLEQDKASMKEKAVEQLRGYRAKLKHTTEEANELREKLRKEEEKVVKLTGKVSTLSQEIEELKSQNEEDVRVKLALAKDQIERLRVLIGEEKNFSCEERFDFL